MNKYTIYEGKFASRWDGTVWTVEIEEVRASAPSTVGELSFSGSEPLLIEWAETGKEEVVCGSTATLKLLSPGDRTYSGLYTIEAGRIGLKVWRGEFLYWSGTLDPEFYEEPYTAMSDYEVELTFSDFGILERLKYALTGMQTIEAILGDALERAGLGGEATDTSLVSSELSYGDRSYKLRLEDLSVRSENFTDEDGEVSNLLDVVEGLLLPLGLRIVQRAGRIWVYDLNGLHAGGAQSYLRWHSNDQVLSVDKVANSVKVTFSPYGDSGVQESEVTYLGATDRQKHQFGDKTESGEDDTAQTYYPDASEVPEADRDDQSFTVFTSTSSSDGVGAALGPGGAYFHIEPLYGGEKCDGVAWGFPVNYRLYADVYIGIATHKGRMAYHRLSEARQEWDTGSAPYRPWDPVLRTYRAWLPAVFGDAGRFRLRLVAELLADVRYNPYAEAVRYNRGPAYDWVKNEVRMVRIAAGVRLMGDDGTVKRHLTGSPTGALGTTGDAMVGQTTCYWLEGDYTEEMKEAGKWPLWLEYYSVDGGDGTSVCCGWKKNRHALAPSDLEADGATGVDYARLPEKLKKLADGQLAEYPSGGGWIEVTLYGAIEAFKYGRGGTVRDDISEGLRQRLLWQLYKAPTIELVDAVTLEAVGVDDIEYKGVINASARDEISFDTICGTSPELLPTARGVYYRSDGLQLTEMIRAGRKDQAEHLLIGTLHSQFAGRHVKLGGSADLLTGGLQVYLERQQGDRLFMVAGDVQDVDAGTSEAVFVELSGDEYEQRL